MTNRKQKFIKYLFALTIILLITDIAIDRFVKKEKLPVVAKISVKQIEKVFFKVLDDYGIKNNWISSKKVKPNQDDSTVAQYFIKVPSDIPVPLILIDINNIIEKDITGFVSEEKKINGLTEIRVYTNEILKLKATLSPDKNIIRTNNELSFIVSDAFDLGEGKFNNFLSVSYPLACTAVPGKNIIDKVDSLKDYGKEYALLLNNDISDSEMKLKQEYQKELLRGSIKNIISSFKDARVHLIDEKSVLYNSPIYNFVRDDFKYHGITLFPKSELIELDAKEDPELFSKFKFYCSDTSGIHQKLFISTFENYQKILPELVRLKKKGHKIIPLSKTYLVQKTK